jgi:chromosome segregation ATPase
VNRLKRDTTLQEVEIEAVTVSDDEELDAILGVDSAERKAIAEITNMVLDGDLDIFAENWSLGSDADDIDNDQTAELIADRNRLQEELDKLRSQYEFECEYVDQLEKEIMSVSDDRDRQVKELTAQIEQLQCQNTALDISQQTLTAELEATQALLKESTKTLELAQTKLSEVTTQRDQFEEELIKHLSNQAQLHQSLRGLENEYVSDLTKVQELEQQIEELQNHVLQQASRASEYEAAIQHWKEQSVRHQHHALQLSGALDRLLEEKPVRHLVSPLEALTNADHGLGQTILATEPKTEPRNEVPLRSQRNGSKVDLPAFLVRHR